MQVPKGRPCGRGGCRNRQEHHDCYWLSAICAPRHSYRWQDGLYKRPCPEAGVDPRLGGHCGLWLHRARVLRCVHCPRVRGDLCRGHAQHHAWIRSRNRQIGTRLAVRFHHVSSLHSFLLASHSFLGAGFAGWLGQHIATLQPFARLEGTVQAG